MCTVPHDQAPGRILMFIALSAVSDISAELRSAYGRWALVDQVWYLVPFADRDEYRYALDALLTRSDARYFFYSVKTCSSKSMQQAVKACSPRGVDLAFSHR